MEGTPASRLPNPVNITLVGEDQERFRREVDRLSYLPVAGVCMCMCVCVYVHVCMYLCFKLTQILEFRIPAECIRPEIKWQCPGENQCRAHYALQSIEIVVVLVIRRCVNAIEATMETACAVEEDGHKVNASVGCKAEGKFTTVTSQDCLSLLTLATTCMRAQMWVATFVEEDDASMVPLNGSLFRRQEDRVGTLSEGSHIATGPLKWKLLFQLCSTR